jgi:NAD(P)-dependent dehydrogenase (short-subunit alcohol dehydrogenase family)
MSGGVRHVFIAGATGYMGGRLAEELIRRGHSVSGLVRNRSEGKLPGACTAVPGNALDRAVLVRGLLAQLLSYSSWAWRIRVLPKPRQFREIDLRSCEESVAAAVTNRVEHFAYVSVAHPAPVMQAYIAVSGAVRRDDCAERVERDNFAAVVRPGAGTLLPLCTCAGILAGAAIPSTRESAERLGLVTWKQMVRARAASAKKPVEGVRIIEVPEIATN